MNVKTWPAALLCGIALALPAAAQEDPVPEEPPPAEPAPAPSESAPAANESLDPPLHRWGGWTIGVAVWNPTLVGTEEQISIVDTGGVAQPLVLESEAQIEETVRVAYHLPKDRGSIVVQYDSMNHNDEDEVLTPGQFNFAESRPFPYLLGVFDDGFADGVSAKSMRKTHEFRLEFQQKAFDTRWARATWGIGYRELSHTSVVDVTYYAIAPNFPPIIPPVGDAEDAARLAPVPDGVAEDSQFSGHGLGASFDVEFPVHRRVSIISGLSIGLIRGKNRSSFSSLSSAYFLGSSTVPMTGQELFDFLANPPVDTDPDDGIPAPTIADIQQQSFVIGLASTQGSQMAQTFDVYLGVQVQVYKGLRIFATMRDVSYVGVGKYVVPRPGPSTETTSLDAGYEGYALGLSWRF